MARESRVDFYSLSSLMRLALLPDLLLALCGEGGVKMEAVTTALTTGISGIATDALTAIGSIIPVALPIAGAATVVAIGIRMFNRVGNK